MSARNREARVLAPADVERRVEAIRAARVARILRAVEEALNLLPHPEWPHTLAAAIPGNSTPIGRRSRSLPGLADGDDGDPEAWERAAARLAGAGWDVRVLPARWWRVPCLVLAPAKGRLEEL
jgi:hypothetical protein